MLLEREFPFILPKKFEIKNSRLGDALTCDEVLRKGMESLIALIKIWLLKLE
jgi:hypothetical protein